MVFIFGMTQLDYCESFTAVYECLSFFNDMRESVPNRVDYTAHAISAERRHLTTNPLANVVEWQGNILIKLLCYCVNFLSTFSNNLYSKACNSPQSHCSTILPFQFHNIYAWNTWIPNIVSVRTTQVYFLSIPRVILISRHHGVIPTFSIFSSQHSLQTLLTYAYDLLES